MSVYVYSLDEMQTVFDQLKSLIQEGRNPLRVFVRGHDAPKSELDRIAVLAWALETAWIAQYAAAARTYFIHSINPCPRSAFTLTALDPDRARKKAVGDVTELARTMRNIIYNAVSNSGMDFCPEPVRDLLTSLCKQIDERAGATARRWKTTRRGTAR